MLWYEENGRFKLLNWKKTTQYMLGCLHGKVTSYAKMKFNKYERSETKQEKDSISVWPSLEELIDDMKTFYWLKYNAREALEKLKKKHQSPQSINKFLWDWMLLKVETNIDDIFALDISQWNMNYDVFKEVTLKYNEIDSLILMISHLWRIGRDLEKIKQICRGCLGSCPTPTVTMH